MTGGHRLKALIIDDDMEFGHLMSRILYNYGIDVEVADSKNRFFDLLKQQRPAFCMVDLSIDSPNDGVLVIEQIRRDTGENLKIFVLTADEDIESVNLCLKTGATDYFTKPIDREIFQSKLTYYLGESVFKQALRSYRTVEDRPMIDLEFDMQILSVDEFGLRFCVPHLIRERTLVRVSGPIIKEMMGVRSAYLILTGVEKNPEGEGYLYTGELDDPSLGVLSKLRRWLSLRQTTAS